MSRHDKHHHHASITQQQRQKKGLIWAGAGSATALIGFVLLALIGQWAFAIIVAGLVVIGIGVKQFGGK